MNVIGMYRPGGSPLHRMPAVAKVGLLLAWAIVAMVFSDPITASGMALAAVMLLISVLPPLKPTLRGMAFIAVLALLAGAYQVYRGEYDSAIDIGADVIGLFAASLAVTSSTPMSELLDLATAAARPFRRIIPPAIPGLMFAIVLRAIPEVATIMRQSRDAARARGVNYSPGAVIIPTASRTVGFAVDLGAALHARGIGDEARADTGAPSAERLTRLPEPTV